MNIEIERLMPQATDAEMGLLGSILLSPTMVMEACINARVRAAHFCVPAHATIYAALNEFWNNNTTIDFIVLGNTLRDRGQIDGVGGIAFVTSLFTYVPTALNSGSYIKILEEKRLLREIIATGNEFSQRGYDEQENPAALFAEFESKATGIGENRLTVQEGNIKEDALNALRSIEARYDRHGEIIGLSTGLKDLDVMTDGLHGPKLIVLAGRPGSGKTSLAMNIAEHIAVNLKVSVGVFSLEMSRSELVERMICSRAKVNYQSVRDGNLSDYAFSGMSRAADEISESALIIDDTAGITIQEMRARCRRWKRQHGTQLFIFDYAQLIETSSSHGSRELAVSEISRTSKLIAKESGSPVILLAQLNRKPEDRKDGRPKKSDLRESGSLEQDADLVCLLHNKADYDAAARDAGDGEAVLIIDKHRNGPTGDVPLTFLKQFTRFVDRAWKQEAERDSSQKPKRYQDE